MYPCLLIIFWQFQSTQPSQAVTYLVCPAIRRPDISIHTALAGCDLPLSGMAVIRKISIHTALAGCDDSGVDGVI